MISGIAARRSDVQLPNPFDVNNFVLPSVSNPDGSDPPFVLIAAFLTNSSLISKIKG